MGFPKTRSNFEYTLNSYVGHNIDTWSRSGCIDAVEKLADGNRRYSLHGSESPRCKWTFVTDGAGRILSWQYLGDSSPCRAGFTWSN